MKKLIAFLLLTAILLTAVSCGAINDTEVSVLWSDMSDEYLATIADAVDRAMYIKNIDYTHYDAAKSGETQLKQAKDAIAAGACALLLNPTDLVTATAILAAAKEADIPMIFICYEAPEALVNSYDKCAVVNADFANVYTTLGEKVAKDLLADYEAYDRNGDGKITYAAFGLSGAAVATVNAKLTEAGKPELDANLLHLAIPTVGVDATIKTIFGEYNGKGSEKNATPVELILTDDDAYVEEMLLALRGYELNYKKLVTHFIPLYTVGIAANAGDLLQSTNEEEKAAYSVMNAIDNGFLSAAALEDDDAIALSAATILANLIKGGEMLADIDEAYLIGGRRVSVPYTVYGE